jgi:hypothetical protein
MKNKTQSLVRERALHKLILFSFFGVFLLEFVNTAGGINQYILPGEERVRCIGNLQLYERVLITVFPFYGLFG